MIDMNLRERQAKQAIKSGGSVCHSLLSEDLAARPPGRRHGKILGGGNGREPERQVRLADGNVLPKRPGFLNFAIDKTGLLMEAVTVRERMLNAIGPCASGTAP